MSRLFMERQRLYAVSPAHGRASAEDPALCLLDEAGRTRALVLGLAHPADWVAMARVWEGVQNDLGWPAPAIAVDGREGLQLWFSLAEPVSAMQAQGLLQALVTRYLPDVQARRLSLWPRSTPLVEGESSSPVSHASPVPAEHAGGQWSAFVSPGLAPVFADTPWLDVPPGAEGQADLLAGLRSVDGALLEHPIAGLNASSASASLRIARDSASAPGPAGVAVVAPMATESAAHPAAVSDTEPRDFLLRVMRDEQVDLALRVEAAKALLPYMAPHRT